MWRRKSFVITKKKKTKLWKNTSRGDAGVTAHNASRRHLYCPKDGNEPGGNEPQRVVAPLISVSNQHSSSPGQWGSQCQCPICSGCVLRTHTQSVTALTSMHTFTVYISWTPMIISWCIRLVKHHHCFFSQLATDDIQLRIKTPDTDTKTRSKHRQVPGTGPRWAHATSQALPSTAPLAGTMPSRTAASWTRPPPPQHPRRSPGPASPVHPSATPPTAPATPQESGSTRSSDRVNQGCKRQLGRKLQRPLKNRIFLPTNNSTHSEGAVRTKTARPNDTPSTQLEAPYVSCPARPSQELHCVQSPPPAPRRWQRGWDGWDGEGCAGENEEWQPRGSSTFAQDLFEVQNLRISTTESTAAAGVNETEMSS